MNTTWRESKTLYFLSLLIAASLLGWTHSRAQRSGRAGVPEEAVFLAFRPFQTLFSRTGRSASEHWQSLTRLRSLEEENRRLREQVAELQSKNQRLTTYFHENERLRRMLDLGPALPPDRVVAEVISRSASNWFRRARINRGSSEGVTPRSVIATHEGVVGQVLTVGRHTSLILLITDQDSGVGGMIQRSRAVGVVRGTGEEICKMMYLDANADVREGDLVVTSQLGEVFPKGLIIGKVRSVEKARHYSSQMATVKPSVDLNRLEEVFVLKRRTL